MKLSAFMQLVAKVLRHVPKFTIEGVTQFYAFYAKYLSKTRLVTLSWKTRVITCLVLIFVLEAESWSGSERQLDTVGHYEAENLCVVEAAYNEPHLQPVVLMKRLTDAQYVVTHCHV